MAVSIPAASRNNVVNWLWSLARNLPRCGKDKKAARANPRNGIKYNPLILYSLHSVAFNCVEIELNTMIPIRQTENWNQCGIRLILSRNSEIVSASILNDSHFPSGYKWMSRNFVISAEYRLNILCIKILTGKNQIYFIQYDLSLSADFTGLPCCRAHYCETPDLTWIFIDHNTTDQLSVSFWWFKAAIQTNHSVYNGMRTSHMCSSPFFINIKKNIVEAIIHSYEKGVSSLRNTNWIYIVLVLCFLMWRYWIFYQLLESSVCLLSSYIWQNMNEWAIDHS